MKILVSHYVLDVRKQLHRFYVVLIMFASFLKVDERAVLKHFDWPEKKADTLREAAFGYRDLKKLESEVSSCKDEPRLPCDIALKKMVALSEK